MRYSGKADAQNLGKGGRHYRYRPVFLHKQSGHGFESLASRNGDFRKRLYADENCADKFLETGRNIQ